MTYDPRRYQSRRRRKRTQKDRPLLSVAAAAVFGFAAATAYPEKTAQVAALPEVTIPQPPPLTGAKPRRRQATLPCRINGVYGRCDLRTRQLVSRGR